MREKLKEQIATIIYHTDRSTAAADYAANRISDLIDTEYPEPSIDTISSYDSLIESFNKMDQALDEHFAVIDKLQAALNPTSVAEERIDV